MIPASVGGNNPPGTGSSTFVLDNGGCCGSWAFEYWNTGQFKFEYSLGGVWYSATSTYDLTSTNVPYFVTGVYNSTGNYIQLYLDGSLQQTTLTSGGPDGSSRDLLVGTGLCGAGTVEVSCR